MDMNNIPSALAVRLQSLLLCCIIFVAVYAYVFRRGATVTERQDGDGIKINWRDQ